MKPKFKENKGVDEGILIPKYFSGLRNGKQIAYEKPPLTEGLNGNDESLEENDTLINYDKDHVMPPSSTLPPPSSTLLPPLNLQPSSKPAIDFDKVMYGDIESVHRYRNLLIEEMRQFLEETTFNEFVSEISKDVIGQDNLELVLAGVFGYITGIAKNGVPPKINMLLTAPSGTGKTETFRALKHYFMEKVPRFVVSQVDLTHITAEGFKGKDTNAIVLDLIEKDTGGYGIVFMDEFDKRISSQNSAEGVDVGQEVQNQILTLVEGNVEIYTNKILNKTASIDSSLTMFIGCGSFNSVREKKKKAACKTIGFTKQNLEYNIYDNITKEDILDAGCSYEMLGRFPLIINYNRLETKAIKSIIENIRYNIMLNLGFSGLIITDEYIQNMINMANSELGCRLFYSSIFQASMNAYKEILKKNILNRAVVELGSDYFEIYEDIQESNERDYGNQ